MSGVLSAGAAAGAAVIALVLGLRHRTESSGGPIGIERWERGRRLARALKRAGSHVGADAFVLFVGGVSAVVSAVFWRVLGSAPAAALGAGCVGLAAAGYVRSADRRYRRRLASQLPIVAQQLSGGLAAGLSLRQAIERAHRELPDPAGTELAQVAGDLRVGMRLETALDRLSQRVPDPTMRMMMSAIAIQRTVGGNLSQALARLAVQMDDRERLEREARTATEQARMSAWLVAALPMAGGLMVELAAPGTLERTLGHGPGRVLLVAAATLEAIGVVLVRHITASVCVSGACRSR